MKWLTGTVIDFVCALPGASCDCDCDGCNIEIHPGTTMVLTFLIGVLVGLLLGAV